ncbi:hypothetical protein X425_03135 [Mycobacterium avium XTB13-223]|nr:hypothetical protein X425_03135 [Mycobacterium avium XTB13-223]
MKMISPSGSSCSGGGHLDAVPVEQFGAGHTLGPPPEAVQVIDDVVAFAGVDQRRHVDVDAVLPERAGHLPHPLGVEIHDAGHEFRGDGAARRGQRGDVVEQPVLGLRRQIDQQALGQPGRRRGRIESGGAQRGGPVAAQIDGDGAPGRGGLGTDLGQRVALEFDHPRLVDLVDHRARRPRQPVGARIQAGGQDHHLTHPGVGGVDEVVVKVLGAHRHSVDHRLNPHRGGVLDRIQVELAVHHLGEEVHPDRAHQRLGERIVDQTAGILGRHGASGRDHRCGGADAGRQVPLVVMRACHREQP